MATKRIPYGISDFERIATENYYYVDKTRFIETIENTDSYLFLIRPRRFGKSLLLSVLESYYDLAKADRFADFYGATWIGSHPTPDRGKYLILKFNFSAVNPEPGKLETSFEQHCDECFKRFNDKYAPLFGAEYLPGFKEKQGAIARFGYIIAECVRTSHRIYLIIDEYDNFANTVLSRYGAEQYHMLTHGTGFFRYFFNKLKEATTGSGAGVARMFITGVSPVTLDDVTSGFNIGTHITMTPQFNRIIGFTESEVMEMLRYYHDQGALTVTPEALLAEMKLWYDNYCFSADCCDESMYNSDMALYFVKNVISQGKAPREMIDINVRTDYIKLRHLVQIDRKLNGNFSVIRELIETGETTGRIADSFPAENLLKPEYFKSLLFYLGLLSIDRIENGDPVLTIPNLTVREQMYSYLIEAYSEAGGITFDSERLGRLMKEMAYQGNWRPVFDFFATEIQDKTTLRQYIDKESPIKIIMLTYMAMTNYFIVHPEYEAGKGFSDIYLQPWFTNHPTMNYSYIIEVKYMKRDDKRDPDILLAEATGQLRCYAADPKVLATKGHTQLCLLAVVFRGWELLRAEKV